MRIVNWDEFQKLPEGTVYQQVRGLGGGLGNLRILGKMLPGDERSRDFTEARLTPAWNDEDALGDEGLEHIGLPKGTKCYLFLTPDGFQRDGLYDYDRYWLIYDEADRKRLAGWLLDPAKAVTEMDDLPEAHAVFPWPFQAWPA